jgi:hypothetical protein
LSSLAGRRPALRLPGARAPCSKDWEQLEAEPGPDREAAFCCFCEVIVAHPVLEELEAEQIAVPTFGEIDERLRPLSSFEPSSHYTFVTLGA